MEIKNSIVTREGDDGLTSFPSCSAKVRKSDVRIELLGTLDEFQGWIAYLYEVDRKHADAEYLHSILRDCQTIMGCLTMRKDISENNLVKLEEHLFQLEYKVMEFQGFVIPGGSIAKCVGNLTRTVARRLERVLDQHALSDEESHAAPCVEYEFYAPVVRKYINRISDYLFLYMQL